MADPFTPVDSAGAILRIGSKVDLAGCTIIGVRADPNNRLNLWVLPPNITIKTINASNPLNGGIDGKALLVSGYQTTKTVGSAVATDIAGLLAQYLAAVNALQALLVASTVTIPSNFLVPDIA